MKFKAVIFDFDGLMFDTESIWKKSFEEANKIFSTGFSEKERVKTIGGNESEIRRILRETNPNIDVDRYRDFMQQMSYNTLLNNGAESKCGLFEILAFIKENKIPTAIVSGSERKVINAILGKANIKEEFFSTFVTGDMKINPKPAPDVYLKACTVLNVKPCEVIVLEDSYNGVRAGHNAGCFTIMIPDTMPVTSEMEQTANLILNDLNEVVEFLKVQVKKTQTAV